MQLGKDAAALANSEAILKDAIQVSLTAQQDINLVINISPANTGGFFPPGTPPGRATEKPKRTKLFNGLGKLFSGLVLLSGNAIVIPTVMIASITALPGLASLAGGVAAVGEALGQLRRE